MRVYFLCSLTLFVVAGCQYDFGSADESLWESEYPQETAESSDSTHTTETGDSSDSSNSTDTIDTSSTTGTEEATGSETGNDTQTQSQTDFDTGSGSNTQVDTDTGTGIASDSDTGTATDHPTTMYLHFWERIEAMNFYGVHELYVGPSNSTNPTKPGWTVIASREDMRNMSANGYWARSLPWDLTAFSGTSIRIAWRYYGMFADTWYLDDICVSSKASLPSQPDCYYWEDFDAVQTGTWPTGFVLAPGPSNDTESKNWETAFVLAHSNPNAASIRYSAPETADRFLITPPIQLP